jgi:SAM-dependent methyltransferase
MRIIKRLLARAIYHVNEKDFGYLLLGTTANMVCNPILDFIFDAVRGTETRTWVKLKDLTISSTNKDKGVHYQPMRHGPLYRLLKQISFPTDGNFIDVGCGKGKAVLMAMEYGFKHVIGIDFSPELCELARRNVEIY